jgi:hypothetical protein
MAPVISLPSSQKKQSPIRGSGGNHPNPGHLPLPLKRGYLVTLEHSGLGDGEDWERIRQNFQHSWQSGLENLASIMDTGQDLRLVQRPMLGVLLNDFNPEIAKKMGLPITEGIRLSGVIDGMGAGRRLAGR